MHRYRKPGTEEGAPVRGKRTAVPRRRHAEPERLAAADRGVRAVRPHAPLRRETDARPRRRRQARNPQHPLYEEVYPVCQDQDKAGPGPGGVGPHRRHLREPAQRRDGGQPATDESSDRPYARDAHPPRHRPRQVALIQPGRGARCPRRRGHPPLCPLQGGHRGRVPQEAQEDAAARVRHGERVGLGR